MRAKFRHGRAVHRRDDRLKVVDKFLIEGSQRFLKPNNVPYVRFELRPGVYFLGGLRAVPNLGAALVPERLKDHPLDNDRTEVMAERHPRGVPRPVALDRIDSRGRHRLRRRVAVAVGVHPSQLVACAIGELIEHIKKRNRELAFDLRDQGWRRSQPFVISHRSAHCRSWGATGLYV